MSPDRTTTPEPAARTQDDNPLDLAAPQGVRIEWDTGQVLPVVLTYDGEHTEAGAEPVTVWTAYLPTDVMRALETGAAHVHIDQVPRRVIVRLRPKGDA